MNDVQNLNSQGIPVIINAKAGRKSWLAVLLEAIFIRPPFIHKEACLPEEKITQEIVKAFDLEGLKARSYVTRNLGDIKKMVRELVEQGERLIVVAGGDGTINEAIHGIVKTGTALGIIPMGTANAFAIELGIPFSLREAVQVIKRGQVRTIDVGKAGEHFFAMGAGMSYDAQVITKVRLESKRQMGSLAYIMHGFLEALVYPFPALKLESDDPSPVRCEGHLVIVTNTRFYGGHFKSAPRALLDDGFLDVLVMKKKHMWNLFRYLGAMRYSDITKLPDVEYFQCRRLKVTSDPLVLVHVDAEIAEKTPCVFECVSKALRVIVP